MVGVDWVFGLEYLFVCVGCLDVVGVDRCGW